MPFSSRIMPLFYRRVSYHKQQQRYTRLGCGLEGCSSGQNILLRLDRRAKVISSTNHITSPGPIDTGLVSFNCHFFARRIIMVYESQEETCNMWPSGVRNHHVGTHRSISTLKASTWDRISTLEATPPKILLCGRLPRVDPPRGALAAQPALFQDRRVGAATTSQTPRHERSDRRCMLQSTSVTL